jgi:four helix bundle protein
VESRAFEDLLVYQRAAALSDEVREAVLCWSRFDRWSSGIQLLRAADSVAANIAEATGRRTMPDQARLMLIARGSVYELQHWLTRAGARHLPVPLDARARADEIGRMLNGLLRSTRN